MTAIRRGPVAALLALTVTLPLAQTAVAAPVSASTPAPAAREAAAVRVELPRPTGPYAVGLSTHHLVDRDREDPWVPSSGARRTLVSLHYPARERTGIAPGPYMTLAEARNLVRTMGEDLLPPGSAKPLSRARTWARTDARPLKGRFPLVVLSPGFGAPRVSLTSLAEDLASRGYVVASVDHAYESEATAFPGRGVLPCVACRKTESGEVSHAAVVRGRAKDVSYLLDRLTGPRPVWKHAGMIDSRKIAMAGHSIGGATASHLMARDSRVDAGVNMDGRIFVPVPRDGLDRRPFLLLGAEETVPGAEASWDRAVRGLDGWKRWLTVEGGDHYSFSDAPVLVGQLRTRSAPAGELTGERSVRLTRTYLAAFLDRHLRGAARPVLDGPTAAHPEIVFHRR
ncbi:alpha/beta hydrolase family protein [Streptomyces sp. NPDC057638]|uniref:alpha/beta hydrolase family protein n=1 Tax=Streptomyces sp. NPDC057638 TaxID=3346190 RepID=UPI0036C3B56F